MNIARLSYNLHYSIYENKQPQNCKKYNNATTPHTGISIFNHKTKNMQVITISSDSFSLSTPIV